MNYPDGFYSQHLDEIEPDTRALDTLRLVRFAKTSAINAIARANALECVLGDKDLRVLYANVCEAIDDAYYETVKECRETLRESGYDAELNTKVDNADFNEVEYTKARKNG
jgi:hypothetical protein